MAALPIASSGQGCQTLHLASENIRKVRSKYSHIDSALASLAIRVHLCPEFVLTMGGQRNLNWISSHAGRREEHKWKAKSEAAARISIWYSGIIRIKRRGVMLWAGRNREWDPGLFILYLLRPQCEMETGPDRGEQKGRENLSSFSFFSKNGISTFYFSFSGPMRNLV